MTTSSPDGIHHGRCWGSIRPMAFPGQPRRHSKRLHVDAIQHARFDRHRTNGCGQAADSVAIIAVPEPLLEDAFIYEEGLLTDSTPLRETKHRL